MNICEITLYSNGNENWTITEAKTKNTFEGIKNNLKKIKSAFKVLETLAGINEGSQYQELYEMGKKTLIDIEKKDDLETIFEVFLIQFLDKVGSIPEITHCEECYTKIEFSKERDWNPLETTCQKCEEKNPMNEQKVPGKKYHDRYRKLVHFLKKNTYEDFQKIKIENADKKILSEIARKYWLCAGNEELKSTTIDIHSGLLTPVQVY